MFSRVCLCRILESTWSHFFIVLRRKQKPREVKVLASSHTADLERMETGTRCPTPGNVVSILSACTFDFVEPGTHRGELRKITQGYTGKLLNKGLKYYSEEWNSLKNRRGFKIKEVLGKIVCGSFRCLVNILLTLVTDEAIMK